MQIVTNIRCHGDGENSIVYTLFGYKCYNHKTLSKMCKEKKKPLGTKKEMAQSLEIPYRDLSWLIDHTNFGNNYPYPHIKISAFPELKYNRDLIILQERIFSHFIFKYFVQKLSGAIDDETLVVDSIDYADLAGEIIPVPDDERLEDSRKNIRNAVQKMCREFGYGSSGEAIYKKLYPAIYTFVTKFSEMRDTNLLQIVRAIKEFSTYEKKEDAFYTSHFYRNYNFFPFKAPRYIIKTREGKLHKPLTKKLLRIAVFGDVPVRQSLANTTKDGWAFTRGIFSLSQLSIRENGDVVLGKNKIILPDLWYIVYSDEFFYLTSVTGPLLGCLDSGKNRIDSFEYVKRHLKNMVGEKDGYHEINPIHIGINAKTTEMYPCDQIERFLPEEIFADPERVRRSMEKFVARETSS